MCSVPITNELDSTREGGGTDSAEGIGAHDWVLLDSHVSWPQVLRAAVDVVLASQQAMSVICGPERILLYNDALARVLGAVHPGAWGRPLFDVFPELEAELGPVLDGVFAGQPPANGEVRVIARRPPEAELDLSLSLTPLRDDRGDVRGIFCVCQGMTGQRSAERPEPAPGNGDDEDRFRATFDHLPVGIAHIALDGRFLRVNDRLCEITGYSRDELREKTFQSITHPSDRNVEVTRARALFEGATDRYEVEKRYVRKDATTLWVHVTASLIRNEQGEAAYRVGVVQDIDERKRLESSLCESEERLRLAAEGAGLGLIDMDPATGVGNWSERMRAIYGIDPDSSTPFDPVGGGMIHSDDASRVRAKTLAAWDPGGDGKFEDEHRIVREDGEVRWVFVRGQVFFEGEGPARRARRARRAYGVVLDITDRKRSEEALRASEERFRLATEAMHGVLYDWQVATDTIFRSAGMFELLGVRPDEMAPNYLAWFERLHPDDKPDVLTRFEQTIARRAPASIAEYRVRHRDGRYVWVWDHTQIVYDEEGRPLRQIGFIVSIDDRKRAESHAAFLNRIHPMMVQQSNPEELVRCCLRALAEHVGVDSAALGEVTIDPLLVTIKQQYRGMQPSLLGVHRFSDCFSDEARRTWMSNLGTRVSDVATDPRTTAYAESFRRLDIASFLSEPVVSSEGARTVLILTCRQLHEWRPDEAELLRDTAARLAAALERARAEMALRESEQRFKRMADTAPSMIWMSDAKEQVTFLSRGWHEFTGQTEVEGLGQGWLEVIHPEDRERVLGAFSRAAAHGEGFSVDFRLQCRGGAYRWVIEAARPRFSELGQFVGHIGSVIDVHERKLAEEALREADRRKDEYLAMLGHELRNPLAAIQSATELLRLTETQDTRLLRARGVLERQSNHMVKLIDGLLEVSRIARGKIHLEKQTIDVRHVLERVLVDRSAQLVAADLGVKKTFPSEPLWISGDPVRLVQVFDNLIGNAIKFTRPHGSITVTLDSNDGRAVACIRDTGAGIRPEMLVRIFEPFQQETSDIARTAGGLGLGLALAKGLVELHQGTIEAHSAGPGTGAEFWITLPLAPAAVKPADAHQAPCPTAGSPSQHILIVEDNVDAAQMLRDLLEIEGHHVSAVGNAYDALDELHHNKADLVLCDIGLPGMSGYDLARAIRSDVSLHDIALVAVTGYGQPSDRERTRNAGFDEHLTKPLGLAALDEVLKRHLCHASRR